MEYIEDGTGRGFKARVDAENRLAVASDSLTHHEYAAIRGEAYVCYTGLLTLTSGNESGLFYVQNTNPSCDLMLMQVRFSYGKSTGGTGDVIFRRYTNPTGGTLLTDKTAAVVTNHDLGISTPVVANVYKGAEGKTVTGGTEEWSLIVQDGNDRICEVAIILSSGQSMAFSVQPKTGNTSMLVSLVVCVGCVNPL